MVLAPTLIAGVNAVMAGAAAVPTVHAIRHHPLDVVDTCVRLRGPIIEAKGAILVQRCTAITFLAHRTAGRRDGPMKRAYGNSEQGDRGQAKDHRIINMGTALGAQDRT